MPLGFPKPEKRPKKAPKRMKQRGKRTIEYEHWRDMVAIPYLETTYGRVCDTCSSRENLDVAHIKGRGSHPHLRMEITNVMFRCRPCHMRSDSGFTYK